MPSYRGIAGRIWHLAPGCGKLEHAATRMGRGEDPLRHHVRRKVRQGVMVNPASHTSFLTVPFPRGGHETVVTVTFAQHQGKTTTTFRQAFFESVGQRDGHQGAGLAASIALRSTWRRLEGQAHRSANEVNELQTQEKSNAHKE